MTIIIGDLKPEIECVGKWGRLKNIIIIFIIRPKGF